jgi:predicted transcriptional regulator with HTH domain
MPTISQKKKDKIQEQILHHLFSISPDSTFTSKISEEIARDEEFTKFLLTQLKTKGLIHEINKNSQGLEYKRRQRWRLSTEAYKAYSKHQ